MGRDLYGTPFTPETVNASTFGVSVSIEPRTRKLLIALRQALIIALGAIEDYLNLPRSIIPIHKRTA